MDLIRQSSESLAGRISFLELGGLNLLEVGPQQGDDLWIRGGFPDSLLTAETLRRFWTMLAHAQGSLRNAAALGRSLGVSGKRVSSYLDLLVDLLLVRRLQPLHANVGKRLTKAPKVYVRDSGLVHTLLGLDDREAVLGHPVAGASWAQPGLVLPNRGRRGDGSGAGSAGRPALGHRDQAQQRTFVVYAGAAELAAALRAL